MIYKKKTPKVRKPRPAIIAVRLSADLNTRIILLARHHRRSKRSIAELFVLNGLRSIEKDATQADYLFGKTAKDY